MNIHNCHFIGATGLYPIEEIITNTSNNLIYNDIYNSNQLINYINNTSNNLIEYTINTSNNLIEYTINTSNELLGYMFELDEAKEDKFTPLTPSFVLASDVEGKVSTTSTTSLELGGFNGRITTNEGGIASLETQINVSPHPAVSAIPILDTLPFYELMGATAVGTSTNTGLIGALSLSKLDKASISHITSPYISPMYLDAFGYLQIALNNDLNYDNVSGEVGLSTDFKNSKLDSSIVDTALNHVFPFYSPMYIDYAGVLQIGLNDDLSFSTITGEVSISDTFKNSKLNSTATANRVMITDASGNIIPSTTISTTELGYLDGLTQSISTSLGNKLDKTATANSVMITDASGNIIPSTTISSTELGYLDGLTQSISTSLGNKLDKTATANSVMITDASGNIVPSSTISSTELGYLDGLTQSISTSLANKEPSFTTLSLSKGGTGKASMTTNRILGLSSTASTTAFDELSLGTGLSFSGTTINSVWTTSTNDIYNNNTGSVRIGTIANTYKLEVGGDVNITGSFRINGTPFTGSSQWTTNTGYISYNNVHVYSDNIKISIPPINFNTWVWYKFLSGALTSDSSGNSRTLTTSGTYSPQDGKDTLSLTTSQDATIPQENWSTVSTDLAISGWFKTSSLANNDKLLEFKTTVIEHPFNPISGITPQAVVGSSTDYYIAFTSTSPYTITFTKNTVCDILVIGGGGGGSSRHAGGGGAGALIYKTNYTISSGSYTISVGAGGTGKIYSTNTNCTNGGDTTITNSSSTVIFKALGGGAGRYVNETTTGGSSGGNAPLNTSTVAKATGNIPEDADVFGNAGGGGTSSSQYLAGGGGGGAGGAGGNASSSISGNTYTVFGGDGGIGKQISITGTATYYAGGGGGGTGNYSPTFTMSASCRGGNASLGGGTAGTYSNVNANNAPANSGSGGGAAGNVSDGSPNSGANGGNGGSGIVIIRYNASVEKNILIKKVNTDLSFQINNTQVYSTPSTNITWSHILWCLKTTNIGGSPFVRISTTSEGTENTYTTTQTIASGTYTNKLGSTTNTGTIYLNDFRIVSIPLTSAIKYNLFNPNSSYKTLVDDASLTTQLATKQNTLIAGTGITISNNIISTPWTTNGNNISFYSALNQGNVGIGVAAPNTYRLEVNGTLNATTIYEGGLSLSNKYQASGSYLTTSGGTLTDNLGIKTTTIRGGIDVYNSDLVVRASGEGGQAKIFLATPFNTDTSAMKCAIIAQGINNWSRSTLHFCLDDTADNSTSYNASISNSKMNLTSSGNLSISGTLSFNKLNFANNVWNTSADNINRFKCELNANTVFGTANQYVWRSSDNTLDLMTLSHSTNNKGILQIDAFQAYQQQFFTQSTYIWLLKYIYYDANNSDLGFYYGSGSVSIKAKVSFNGNGGYTNFTGSHRNISDNKNLYNSDYKGYIVRSTGKYKNLNSKYHRDYIKGNIIMDDALPIVELTSNINDKSVWGVISTFENSSNSIRDYSQGHFTSCMNIEGGDLRLIVNGCGEGSIWVSDYNGILENGDYITTSPILGIGMKQDDDILHTYTVAKITMDCDFNPQLIPIKVIKQEEYIVYDTSNLTSNIEYIVYDTSNLTSNIEYTINTSNIATSNIPYTITISHIETSNVLDEDGNPVYEYKLDESSNIVYDYEYEVRTVMHNEIEYKMAFVGCSYKCS